MSNTSLSVQEAVPLLLSAAASVVLFYSGLFAFVFAVPVQYVYTRYGPQKGSVTAVASAVVIVAVHLLQVTRLESVPTDMVTLLLLDSLMPVGLLAGLAAINLNHRHPWWGRLLLGSGVALLGAVPSLRILAQAGDGAGPLSDQISAMVEMLGVTEDTDQFVRTIQRVAMNTVGIGIVATLAANWWVGRTIVLRRYGLMQSVRPARVMNDLVWIVIAGLAIVVGSEFVETGFALPVGWNALLVGSFLFGVQGVGLIQHLVRLRGASDRGERWVPTIVLMLLFIPGINILVMLGVPLLGMSEVWVDYRRGDEYEGHSER
ncbi:MAG: hypothetical protein ACOCYB_03455 [Alkalispirochaeta sp.]